MSYISNEFIYFDPDFKGPNGDFTNNDVFSPNKRLEFLSNYAAFLKNSYSLPERSQRVVELSEAEKLLEGINTQGGAFDRMQAYTADVQGQYKNWSIYTKKAVVEEGKLILKSAELPPNPSAVYYFEEASPCEIILKFTMDGEYAADINGVVRETTTARTVELRNGIETVLKIAFYSNGECFVRCNRDAPYHAKATKLGSFEFDTENILKIKLGEQGYAVALNGDTLENLPYSCDKKPDMLFFGSGMFHLGDWVIEPIAIDFGGNSVTDFFTPCNKNIGKLYPLGEVKLPYAIGGAANREKMLILQKDFILPQKAKVFLEFECLDPGGEVYIDETQYFSTDGFDSFSIDISKLDRDKTHTLQVRVNPRAPEVLFQWHRQSDPYNGWFCGNIRIKAFDNIFFEELRAETKAVEGDVATVDFSGYVSKECKLEILVKKIYSKAGEENKVAELTAKGNFKITSRFKADLWSPSSPNLYKVCFTAYDEQGTSEFEYIETGFRTIEQKNGEILLNGKRIDLSGALLMQFLPPHDKTSETHICPSDAQIMWQEMMLKKLGGNTLRLHILGYGTNDERYARYADRLGIMLIWTTRYIDSVETVQWQGKWRAGEVYLKQLRRRINHPSIIMWEGSNEFRSSLTQIDGVYDEFVPAVKSIDMSRLICPISHLYYAADCYPVRNCGYYSDDGASDHNGQPVSPSEFWNDELVVRSAHTYSFLLGYGSGWDKMREQGWSEQKNLFASKEHAYIVSEFAVIGRQDPDTSEAKNQYFNEYSYEFPDERVLGIDLNKALWRESQAYQALAAHHCIKKLRLNDADGMLWCCLMGGANDGGYLKPIIDNYGYAKLGFYTMKTALQDVCAFTEDVDIKKGEELGFQTVLFGNVGERYKVEVEITDKCGNTLERHSFDTVECRERKTILPFYSSEITENGYYGIRYNIEVVQ